MRRGWFMAKKKTPVSQSLIYKHWMQLLVYHCFLLLQNIGIFGRCDIAFDL